MPSIDKYLVSKVLFSFFSATTIILFFLLHTGGALNVFGSIECVIVVYSVNTAILIPVTLWYIVERSHKDVPEKESDIIELYAQKASQDIDELRK